MERSKLGRNQRIGITIAGGLHLLAFLFVIVTAIPIERLQWWADYTKDFGPWSMALILGPAALVKVAQSVASLKQPKPPAES